MAVRFPFRVKASTSSTASPFTVVEVDTQGWRSFTQAVSAGDLANGDTVACIVVNTTALGSTGKVLEYGLYTWDNTAKTLTRTTTYQPNATPVAWGAGTKDIYVVDNPLAFLQIANNLSDVVAATARGNLGLGNAALTNVGTGSGNVVQLNGSSQIPAVDGSLITGLKIPQVTRVAADVAYTTAVLGDITGLTFNVSAGITYRFMLRLYINATGTGGFKLNLTSGGSSTITDLRAHAFIIKETATAFLATQQVVAGTGQFFSLASAVDDDYIEVSGMVTINAGGTFKPQFSENTANGTTTIRRGSHMELQIVT